MTGIYLSITALIHVHKILFLASCLLLLIGASLVQTQDSQIEWKNFASSDLAQILETPENYYLILFHNGTCVNSCAATQTILLRNFKTYISLGDRLKVSIVNYEKDIAIADEIGLDEENTSGLYGFSRGIPIRLDSEQPNYDLDKEIKGFFSKVPIHLENVGLAKRASQHNAFIHFYYGAASTSVQWAQFELSSRLASAPFYYSNSSEVAALFGALRKRTFLTFDVAANHTTRLFEELIHENIERFVETSTKPIPQKFNLDALRTATSNLLPVIVYKGGDKTRHEYLTKVFSSGLQDIVRNYFQVFELSG